MNGCPSIYKALSGLIEQLILQSTNFLASV